MWSKIEFLKLNSGVNISRLYETNLKILRNKKFNGVVVSKVIILLFVNKTGCYDKYALSEVHRVLTKVFRILTKVFRILSRVYMILTKVYRVLTKVVS